MEWDWVPSVDEFIVKINSKIKGAKFCKVLKRILYFVFSVDLARFYCLDLSLEEVSLLQLDLNDWFLDRLSSKLERMWLCIVR